MSKSKFIVIEGLEGAGKSTAMNLVEEFLKSKGIDNVVTCREPGGTVLGENIRTLIKDPSLTESVDSRTELLLMYASRIQLVENVIRPALKAGKWVLCDRFYYSTFAYQGGGRNIDLKLIQAVHDVSLGNFVPDATLYMDIDPEIGLARAAGRGELDRFELEDIQFFKKTRVQYLTMCDENKEIHSVDASGTQAEVASLLKSTLEKLDLF
ncbi:MAG: dTMP kinase [Lentisphaeraceae bacterium]|nr:dTMP kinase [Lentisphaeraceae bacterium]